MEARNLQFACTIDTAIPTVETYVLVFSENKTAKHH